MSLKKAYLYLVSIISMVIMVVGGIMLINLALKTWIFKKADNYPVYPCIARPADPTAGAKAIECDEQATESQRQYEAQTRTSQRQQQAAQAIAMILVATPVWWYHWKNARKEV